MSEPKPIKITKVNSSFEREYLNKPFGFKGNSIKRIWQVAAQIESASGIKKVGLGVQSVLWCDPWVFVSHSENGGNAMMYTVTERALQLLRGQSFTDPIQLQESIFDTVHTFARTITRRNYLRKTFTLNALVPLDNAAWLLYAAENGLEQFDQMIPEAYRSALSHQNSKVVAMPTLGYGTTMEELKKLADQGYFMFKIKLGAPGTQEEMLEKDCAFLKAIHETIGRRETLHTKNGKIPYYFDANGRYDKHETLKRFLDYAKKIGALKQIALIEEPFGERNQEDVAEITAYGPRVAADESAHTDEETVLRIEQGYNAIAVKAVAKTLSMTLKIAKVAQEAKVPCFCADLTVNPVLVEWNKNVAARLAPFPGLGMGLQEVNGWQNYRHWDSLMAYHPMSSARWVRAKDGIFNTDQDFLDKSGGIFSTSRHYESLFK